MGLTDNEVIESRKKFGANVINSTKKIVLLNNI